MWSPEPKAEHFSFPRSRSADLSARHGPAFNHTAIDVSQNAGGTAPRPGGPPFSQSQADMSYGGADPRPGPSSSHPAFDMSQYSGAARQPFPAVAVRHPSPTVATAQHPNDPPLVSSGSAGLVGGQKVAAGGTASPDFSRDILTGSRRARVQPPAQEHDGLLLPPSSNS